MSSTENPQGEPMPSGSESPRDASLNLPPSPAPIRIALSGKSGAGKTELARHLVQRLAIQRCSPGDIYRSVSQILFAQTTKELMNRLTVALRAMDPLCVTNASLRQAANSPRGVVFDSMRFKEDLAFFRAHGFMTVRIECDARIRAKRLMNRGEVRDARELKELEEDRTEMDLDDMPFDLVLANDKIEVRTFLESAFQSIQRQRGEN